MLVLFGVMVSYLNPMVNLVDAWRDSKAGKEQLTQLQAQYSSLRQQVGKARDPITLEREARKLGMVKPGEHAYVVRGIED